MRTILILCVTLSFLLLCSIPQAISCIGPECQDDIVVYGSPYDPTSSGSFSPITSGNWIGYYNPLNEMSGGLEPIYGVNAGTSSDIGSGWGYGNALQDTLHMYLAFDLPGSAPAYQGYLKFFTIDLDLVGANDPPLFLEDIQFHFSDDGGGTWNPASPVIDNITDSSPGQWDVGGNAYLQTITFENLLISQDPLLARLDFSTMFNDYNWRGTNTQEWLKAELCVHPVPIPAAIWLLGFGMTGLGILRKFKLKS